MDKISLTDEYIAKNFKSIFLGKEMVGRILFQSLLFVLSYIWATLQQNLIWYILLPIEIIDIVIWYIYKVMIYLKLKKGEFRIETDILMNIQGKNDLERTGPIIKPPKFYFQKHGKFTFQNHGYTHMITNPGQTDIETDHRLAIGDTFYMVIVGKKVVSVYNTRIFEYQPKTN